MCTEFGSDPVVLLVCVSDILVVLVTIVQSSWLVGVGYCPVVLLVNGPVFYVLYLLESMLAVICSLVCNILFVGLLLYHLVLLL